MSDQKQADQLANRKIKELDEIELLIDIKDNVQSVYSPVYASDFDNLLSGLQRTYDVKVSSEQRHEWEIILSIVGFIGSIIAIGEFIKKVINRVRQKNSERLYNNWSSDWDIGINIPSNYVINVKILGMVLTIHPLDEISMNDVLFASPAKSPNKLKVIVEINPFESTHPVITMVTALRGALYLFLEGEKDLSWIKETIKSSGILNFKEILANLLDHHRTGKGGDKYRSRYENLISVCKQEGWLNEL